jgi:hypothetical protein
MGFKDLGEDANLGNMLNQDAVFGFAAEGINNLKSAYMDYLNTVEQNDLAELHREQTESLQNSFQAQIDGINAVAMTEQQRTNMASALQKQQAKEEEDLRKKQEKEQKELQKKQSLRALDIKYFEGIGQIWINSIAQYPGPKGIALALAMTGLATGFWQAQRSLIEGMATGGWVNGIGTGTSDENPRMLSKDEFVVREKAAKKNAKLVEYINIHGGNKDVINDMMNQELKNRTLALPNVIESNNNLTIHSENEKVLESLDSSKKLQKELYRKLDDTYESIRKIYKEIS